MNKHQQKQRYVVRACCTKRRSGQTRVVEKARRMCGSIKEVSKAKRDFEEYYPDTFITVESLQ